jgi:hypothetical protein
VRVVAQPRVIGEVPTDVIRIAINQDAVGIPQPAVHKGVVVRCDGEVRAIKPKALAAAAGQMKDMTRAESGGEPPVLPGTRETLVRIEATRVVPHAASN